MKLLLFAASLRKDSFNKKLKQNSVDFIPYVTALKNLRLGVSK